MCDNIMMSSSGKRRALQSKLTGGHIFQKKQKSEEYVVCPVCEIEINSTLIHLHIDNCLQKTTERDVELRKEQPFPSTKQIITLNNQPKSTTTTNTKSDACFELPDDIHLVEMSEVPGLWLVHNFISEEEEADICRNLDEDVTPWRFSSFNGNCNSKSFGVKTQFGSPGEERCVRRNNPALGEFDIPEYLDAYPIRLQRVIQQALNIRSSQSSNSSGDSTMGLSYQKLKVPPPEVVQFTPNECNANS